jgi:plastocyanin
MLLEERAAISKMQAVIAVVVIVVAAGGGGALLLSQGGSQSGPSTIVVKIYESDPIRQADSFDPTNVTVNHGSTVVLAVQNGDDQARTFQISAYNINQTIPSGNVERITVTVGEPGVYEMFLPATTAASAANGRASPSVTGYLIVT